MHDFPDSNFKLVILDQLLKEGSFTKRLNELRSDPKYAENYTGEVDYGEPIPEIEDFLRDVKLTDDDLEKVTDLCFDGGNDIYQIICPFWDGESDYFDIRDIGGFELLKNLRSVTCISMISRDQIDRLRSTGISVR
ncbi:DUF6892 domain-containing protein [Luteimonas salinilitoris]|uniref:DUF6892 domain-containing protein n=1 Tax=Luteimonas salinilitoris TaxID=3237697 RepID=A0ABV4HRI1_9GAMM